MSLLGMIALVAVACNQSPAPGTADTTPPTIILEPVATPILAASTVMLRAAAEDDVSGTRVEFFAGSASLGEAGALPFEVAWPVDATLNGTYELRAIARDTAGNLGESGAVTVRVAIEPGAVPDPPRVLRWTGANRHPAELAEAEGIEFNGKLYVFGGYDNYCNPECVGTRRAYVFDPSANSWTPLADAPLGVSHAGIALADGKVYLAGGYVDEVVEGVRQRQYGTSQVMAYDLAAGTWSLDAIPPLPVPRSGGQLAVLGRYLHFVSGSRRTAEDQKGRAEDVGDHWALSLDDLAAGWQERQPLPNPRQHSGSAVLDGVLYYVGGQWGHNEQLVTQADVHRYDPVADTWTAVASLPFPRGHISGATFVRDGRILVAGGETSYGRYMSDVVAYDPSANQWSALTRLPQARHSGVARAVGGAIYYTTGSFRSETFRGVLEGP